MFIVKCYIQYLLNIYKDYTSVDYTSCLCGTVKNVHNIQVVLLNMALCCMKLISIIILVGLYR